jgi:O-antigen/teichoic acid export membrane protein
MKQELLRLSKNSLIYGVGGVLIRLFPFLFLPVFTAYLTPTDYGVSAILGLVTFVTTSVFSLGVGVGAGPCYFEGNCPEQKERTTWTAFVILAASCAAIVLVGVCFASQISVLAFRTSAHAYLVRLTLLAAALNILTIPFVLRLQFEEHAGIYVVLTIASSLVSLGASLLMVVILGRGIRGLIEAGLVGQGVTFLLFLFQTVRNLTFRFNWKVGKELLRLSLPFVPSFAFLFLLQHGNKYLLQWMCGLEDVGIYNIGFNFGSVLTLVVSAFNTAWYPYFMSFLDRQQEARQIFGRILTYYVLGVGSLSLLFFIVARPVVMLMTQPAFHQAYKAVGFSASAQLLIGVFTLLLPGIYFAKEVKYVNLVQGAAALVSLGLNLVLIRAYGGVGAAAALAIGMLLLVVFQIAWNVRRRYFVMQCEWTRVGIFLLISVAYAIATLWDPGFSPIGLTIYLAALAGLLPVWVILLLTAEERVALRGVMPPFLHRGPHRP